MALFTITSEERGLIPCDQSISASGNQGIYEAQINLGEDVGTVTLNYAAAGVPDRFEIFDENGIKVLDTRYVGGSLSQDTNGNYTYPGLIDSHEDLAVFEFDGTSFVATGETRDVTVTQAEVADGSANYPTSGSGTRSFQKSSPTPTTYLLRVTGVSGGTAWNIPSLSCPV